MLWSPVPANQYCLSMHGKVCAWEGGREIGARSVYLLVWNRRQVRKTDLRLRPGALELCGVRGGPSWLPPPLLWQPKATGPSLPVSSLAFLISWDWDQFVDAFGALRLCLSHLP